ncbi:MAG: hypothetical protein AB8B87_26305 [Granulosicoccus sp.]
MEDQKKTDDAVEEDSVLTTIRRLTKNNTTIEQATTLMMALLNTKFEFRVLPNSLKFDTNNELALNSLRAEFKTKDGQHLFLKCHHEEGELARVGEYYRSGILEKAGFPIEPALYQSSIVGEQMVIYTYRDRDLTPELHSIARDIEATGCCGEQVSRITYAFDRFQQRIGKLYLSSLHWATPSQVAAEAVHSLYHRRLVDHEDDQHFGARIREFYLGRQVTLPGGRSIPFEEFWHMRWSINGRLYNHTLHHALTTARQQLLPTKQVPIAALTAHGDDHTGNLLYNADASPGNELTYFDPAFAGNHIPALQAPCKALYHICFAHPNMLYNPSELDVDIKMEIDQNVIVVTHNWQLSELRQLFLNSQLDRVWAPLLSELRKCGMLPDDWDRTIASTLLCCPILCKNLIAGLGSPNPLTEEASLLTFSIAMQLAEGDLAGINIPIKSMLPRS